MSNSAGPAISSEADRKHLKMFFNDNEENAAVHYRIVTLSDITYCFSIFFILCCFLRCNTVNNIAGGGKITWQNGKRGYQGS